MTQAATGALRDAGHDVIVSDLYAMGFNPVSGRQNFTTVSSVDYCRQQAEEAYAAAHDGFAPEIHREMDKLFWCDALILQFPLWWFSTIGSINWKRLNSRKAMRSNSMSLTRGSLVLPVSPDVPSY